MIRILAAITFLTGLAHFGFSAQPRNETLQGISQKYRSAKLIEMKVEKTVKLELQGRETKYSGKIFLANKKFRWENKTPQETLLIFDGSMIWSVQIPPKELGGSVQIARGKIDKKTKSQILVSTLLGGDFEKNFKVLKEVKSNGISKLDVSPLGNGLDVKVFTLSVDLANKTLVEVSYFDDLGNKTTMAFSEIKFLDKSDNSKFKYQPPNGAQVTEL
jgi:outer membrane lipoprotein carrier protein